MKRYLVLIVALVFIWVGVAAQPNGAPIIKDLDHNNVENIIKYFDNTLDITTNSQQSTYSKAQAENVVRDFFAKNSIKTFEKLEVGPGRENTFFIVGETRVSNHRRYKVYLLFKQNAGSNTLTQVKFEMLK